MINKIIYEGLLPLTKRTLIYYIVKKEQAVIDYCQGMYTQIQTRNKKPYARKYFHYIRRRNVQVVAHNNTVTLHIIH